MTLLLLLVLLAVVVAIVSKGRRAAPSPRPPMLIAAPTIDKEEESPTELAERDPIDALLRYGTPADAARLAEQGVDLSGLGYEAPREP